MPPGTFYTASGWASAPRVAREMAVRFPSVAPTSLTSGYVIYSYLEVIARFTKPYDLDFGPAQGRHVAALASPKKRSAPSLTCGPRFWPLIAIRGGSNDGWPSEFALDLDQTSQPVEIVVAKVPPAATLGATIAYVETQAAAQTNGHALFSKDVVAVPEVRFKDTHRFKELETGMLDVAQQMLDFTSMARALSSNRRCSCTTSQ